VSNPLFKNEVDWPKVWRELVWDRIDMKKFPTLKVGGVPLYVEPPSEVEKALAEAEAMQKDALRYQWLRAHAHVIPSCYTPDQVDEFVDSQMHG